MIRSGDEVGEENVEGEGRGAERVMRGGKEKSDRTMPLSVNGDDSELADDSLVRILSNSRSSSSQSSV